MARTIPLHPTAPRTAALRIDAWTWSRSKRARQRAGWLPRSLYALARKGPAPYDSANDRSGPSDDRERRRGPGIRHHRQAGARQRLRRMATALGWLQRLLWTPRRDRIARV